jgi:hypothetical protein
VGPQEQASKKKGKMKAMKKLILFTTAMLVAGQASAYAHGQHSRHHRHHLMSAHAQWQGQEPEYMTPDRGYPGMGAPLHGGGYGYGGYGSGSDDYAEGRTSGSP